MKMKSYTSFDEYLTDQPPKNQRIIHALRKFMQKAAPQLKETVKWGNGCWVNEADKIPVTYVYSDKEYVQFGFFRGASFKDPKGLLQGKGQYVKHIKVYKKSDIDERYFGNLLTQAIKASSAIIRKRS
ncbi:MAG: DUF1801 domain-containing protein [Ignavibacteriales bacterium]|nr:DUF1801 domain-containing protein [Ignavibacteriales bacterium]MBI3786849.1 DUF1801 domain-containing protein [Ignavibacteriales bacterium]